MSEVVVYIAIFVGLGAFFLFIHLVMGTFVRPMRSKEGDESSSEQEKLTIYECGEPTIGSAWVQFDLRYYVVALLFVIFDVEIAFFFPWAVVFGKANTLAQAELTDPQRIALTKQLVPDAIPSVTGRQTIKSELSEADVVENKQAAKRLAILGFLDILVFFGVLLVGFAYLWKRGDINWIRATTEEPKAGVPPPPMQSDRREELLHHV